MKYKVELSAKFIEDPRAALLRKQLIRILADLYPDQVRREQQAESEFDTALSIEQPLSLTTLA